jgi:hypothetical protein
MTEEIHMLYRCFFTRGPHNMKNIYGDNYCSNFMWHNEVELLTILQPELHPLFTSPIKSSPLHVEVELLMI